jgi:hypothetical protein
MSQSIEGINGSVGKALDWIRWASQVLLLPLLCLFAWAWWNHEERIDALDTSIQVMQGNRFTSEDGLRLTEQIAEVRTELKQKEIDDLRRELAELRDKEDK